MKIAIINGPNVNLLGKREPEIYGSISFDEYLLVLRQKFPSAEMHTCQSNIEGELVMLIQEASLAQDAIIINAGAYTHTSIAIDDAIRSVNIPVVEVHISNTFSREKFRHKSYLSPIATGIIIGFGLKSYDLAIESILI
jgi:3-dehydroquinate dehydratase-2